MICLFNAPPPPPPPFRAYEAVNAYEAVTTLFAQLLVISYNEPVTSVVPPPPPPLPPLKA